jgi:ABC-type dipeptide/oligopeptide/nickel transport system permease component
VRRVRRVGVLIATVLAAAALGHVFLTATDGARLTATAAGTPGWLVDVFIHGDLGHTDGRGCNQLEEYHPLCPTYVASSVADMLRERVPIDLALLLGGLTLGTLAGIAGGRWCAIRPDSRRTHVLHGATALQLSTPVFFEALLVLFYFSSNASEFVRLPFLSGQGEYVPPGEDPLQFVKAMWLPWVLAALPLAAVVLRITEATLGEQLQEDFVRTARAKGLSERRVVNRHALPVAGPAIAAMTGVNASTMLINVAVIEYAYSIPGLFRVINTAVRPPADILVLQGLVIEGVVLVVVANALADAVQGRLDPRVRLRA